MNNFTKEELMALNITILKDMQNNPCTDSLDRLREKILLMIDNYCEHESSEPILVLNKKCIKCACHLETRPWGNYDNQ